MRQERLRQQLVQQQERLRQQLVPKLLGLVLVQQLELGLQLGLLFYRKRPGRKLQRWLPKQVICSFLDTLICETKIFEKANRNGLPLRV